MHYGIFDHLDRGALPLRDYYEARLQLIEAYERAGFYAYHMAEHHSSPIGMAPSPSVFMAAIAQRTKTLRFGPMVYALPLHHPLRLIEEICMVDQLSNGRLEIGFGRGSSPTENSLYGQDPALAQEMYTEGRELILRGLTEKTLSYGGKHYKFTDVPMELEPLQRPHPPMWYGVHSVEAAERGARQGLNMISLDSAGDTRSFYAAFRRVWNESHGERPTPKLGLSRFIVVADSDEQGLSIARRAYPVWHRNFYFLARLSGRMPTHPREPEFDAMMNLGQAVAGSAKTVREFLQGQLDTATANYLVGQFAFGDLTLAESLRSVELFKNEVMTQLRGSE